MSHLGTYSAGGVGLTVSTPSFTVPVDATYCTIGVYLRGIDGADTTVSSASLGSQPFTLDSATLREFTGFQAVECGYILAGDMPSGSVTATASRASGEDGVVVVVSFFDEAVQSAPKVALSGYPSSPPDPVATLITTDASASLVDFIGTEADAAVFTEQEVGQTGGAAHSAFGGQCSFSSSYREVANAGSHAMSWDTAGNTSMTTHVVLAIEEASATQTTIDDITFDVPEWIGLPAGDHTLEAEDDDGIVSLAGVSYELPAGWAQSSASTASDELKTHFLATYGITVDNADYVADGPNSAVRLLDASAGQWTTETTYSPIVIDSASNGPFQEGDTITINHSNANASGKTFTLGGLAITPDSSNATVSVLTVPPFKTFGDGTLLYNTDLIVTVTDNGLSASVTRQVQPNTGDYYEAITALSGLWALPEFSAFVIGDIIYAELIAGTVEAGEVVDVAVGAFPADTSWRFTNYSVADQSWGAPGDVTIPPSDEIAPVLTLLGSSSVTQLRTVAYSDAGATATDNADGDITSEISVTGTVDVNTVGTYTLTYNVSDAAGNAAVPVNRTVIIEADAEIPVITMLGTTPITHDVFDAYVDAGATASDNLDGNITNNIQVTSTVNTNVTGAYTVRYNVSDAEGNDAVEVVRSVNVIDQEPPVITLNGSANVDHPIGVPYVDAGATAIDAYDGDVTGEIAANNTVNRNVEGAYSVFYDVSDSNGNAAIQAVRNVNVLPSLDTEAPVITLFGANPVYIANGEVYNDAGARADDDTDGVITNNIQTINPVNTSINSEYTVRYNVSDAAGNAATEVTRTVIVVASLDVDPPIITLSGPTSISIPYGEGFSEPGYSANDDEDGNVTGNVVVTNPVNSTIPGTYTVRYNVSDAAGNSAIEVTRLVTVQAQGSDNNPVITLNGGSVVDVLVGDQYIDAGATASDAEDGNLSSFIVVVSDVDTSTAGAYSVVYMVVDSDGNSATPVIRSVNVIDSVIPRLAVNGPAVSHVLQNATFTDHGASVTSAVDGSSTVYAPEAVDSSVLGSYLLSYNYTDADSNVAKTVYRTVIVKLPDSLTDSGLGILSNIAVNIAA